MTRAALSALLSHWTRHPLQLVTLLAGLALATALWSGVQAINAEARASYDRAATTLGQQTLDRLTAPGGIAPETFAMLRRAGWQVTPVIEGDLRRGETTLSVTGIDPLTAPPQAGLAALAGDDALFTRFLDAPGLLLVAPETAAALEGADLPPREIGADLAPGTALTDITTAERLLARSRYSYLAILPDQPLGLPPLDSLTDLTRSTPEDRTDLAELTGSFHLNLTAFGLLSFAVGLFIVQSAIGLAFEQRRATFRTLRALGLGLTRLVTLLALELGLFALIAGLIGIALGYAIAATLLPGVAGTLRGLYGAEISGQLSFDPVWALSGLGITLAGTVLAGGQALWRVAQMPLLAPALPRAWARASALTMRLQAGGAALLLGGSAALAIWGSGLIAGFACLAALLIGAALALPPLFTAALGLAQRLPKGPVGQWLVADARQQVPALSLALMALLLALSANIGVGTMVGSFRATFTGWLDQRLAAELYVTTRSPGEARALRSFAEDRAGAVLPIWSVEASLRGQPAQIFGIADDPTYRENWPLLSATPDVWDAVADGAGVLVNEQLYRRENIELGDVLALTADWSLPVVGVYSDYGNPAGQAMTGFDALSARFPDRPVLRFALRVPPEDAPALAQDLRDWFDLPEGAVVDQAEVKALSLRVFEQTFLVTGALNVLTLGVAGFALLTSLLTLSGLRLPQLAPVWALGLRPARLAQLELARTLLLAALTWALAMPVGLLLAWVLLAVVNVEAFGWRLPMQYFPMDWLRLGGLALLAAALATAWPAWRLTRLPPDRLLRTFAHDR